MRLFDLHCDTAGLCFDNKQSLYDGYLQLNLCKGKSLDEWCQFFAIWISDLLRGREAEKYFDKALDNLNSEVNKNSEKIKLCKDISDLNEAISGGKCAGLIACEGASPFADAKRISFAKECGVKLITLTWDGENELGFGAQSGSKDGLKPKGKALVKEMERQNIVADVSHLNRAGFCDVISSGVKVVASHSNCESVLQKTMEDSKDKSFACRRSLNDEQIRILRECGGLIGLNFCRMYLGNRDNDGFEAVYRHARHLLDMGCEDVIAIGSDFDGCEINPELDGIEKISDLYSYFICKDIAKSVVDKIFFENAYNFFKNVLQM